jgi:hypothetical protein
MRWAWHGTNFNTPVIFWSELKLFGIGRLFGDEKDFYEALIERFPMLKIFRETPNSPIIIQPDDNYILVTDICPHNIGFNFGVFSQEHFITELKDNLSLEELKVLQKSCRKNFVFCYLQNVANRDSEISWAQRADDCHKKFLSKIDERITEKTNDGYE